MGETADQIKQQIDEQREQLGSNLQQLETKVKETVDWRTQFEQRPMAGIGLAFGAGFLLSVLMPGGNDKSSSGSTYNSSYSPVPNYGSGQYQPQQFSGSTGYGSSYTSQPQPRPKSPEMNEITETIENIRGAVMGLAATRLRSFLAEAVPGFQDEYEQAREKRGASEMSKIDTELPSNSSTSSSSSQFNGNSETVETNVASTSGTTPTFGATSPSQATYRP